MPSTMDEALDWFDRARASAGNSGAVDRSGRTYPAPVETPTQPSHCCAARGEWRFLPSRKNVGITNNVVLP
jgi:hypothetical protein